MNTRQWFGLYRRQWILAGVMAIALPVVLMRNAHALELKDCGRPEPDADTVNFCTSLGIPQTCFLPNLSAEEQRSCDQQRFQGEPHFDVVRLSADGAVRSIQLLRTDTGRTVMRAYPHGATFAVPDSGDSVVRMHTEFLHQFLNARPTPGSLTTTSPGYATGLPIGWNDSTGATSGQCFNYTISNPGAIYEQAGFSSQNAASSTAAQIKVSATVSGSYGAFKANDEFSYSDNYQSSTNSSNQYFNIFSLRALNTSVDATNPLTTEGKNAGASFATHCGTKYLETAPVGMVATLSVNYGSSSQTTQTNVSNTFKATFSFVDSLSAAVSAATQDTSSSSYFNFVLNISGGSLDAAAFLNDALAMKDASTNEAYYVECADGNISACNTFTSNMHEGATKAIEEFDQEVADLTNQASPDLSLFDIFPNGVANAPANMPTRDTNDVPNPPNDTLCGNPTTNDPCPLQKKLVTYTYLMNQIATLANRTNTLYKALSVGTFNGAQFIDLRAYLNTLFNVYHADRDALLSNLGTCLQATSATVATACAPIINNTALNAFEYYAAGQPRANFFAQQNTLALQYVGARANLQFNPGLFYPLDVMYVNQLPSGVVALTGQSIAGEAALVTFKSRRLFPKASVPPGDIWLLALTPNQPLSTQQVSTEVRDNPPALEPFTIFDIGDAGVGNGTLEVDAYPGFTFTTIACTPTFDSPCGIDYANTFELITHSQIQGLFGGALSVTPTALQGSAEKVGSDSSKAKLRIKGKAVGVGPIDLSTATLELTRVLHETNAGGELLGSASGDITPVVLTPNQGSKPTKAIFATSSQAAPRIRATLDLLGPSEDELDFTINIDRASINLPLLCDEPPVGITTLQFRLVLADRVNLPVVIHDEPEWLCRKDKLVIQ